MQNKTNRFKYTSWLHQNGPTVFPLIRDPEGRALSKLKPYLATVQKSKLLNETPSEVLYAMNLYPNLYYELLRIAWINPQGFLRMWALSPGMLYLVAKYVSSNSGLWRECEAALLLNVKHSRLADLFEIPGSAKSIARIARHRDYEIWESLEDRHVRKRILTGRPGKLLKHAESLITGDSIRIVRHMPPSFYNVDILEIAGRHLNGNCNTFDALTLVLRYQQDETPRWIWGSVKSVEQILQVAGKAKRRAAEKRNNATYPNPPLEPDGFYQNIGSFAELKQLGDTWHNCAKSYHESLLRGSSVIYFHETNLEADKHVVLVSKTQEKWEIQQVVGPHNRKPSDWAIAETNKWFREILDRKYIYQEFGPFGPI